MAKLVDAPDLGSGDFGRVGSSPIRRTVQASSIVIERGGGGFVFRRRNMGTKLIFRNSGGGIVNLLY